MTPEAFLQHLIETYLPSFIGKIHTGNGADFQTFLFETANEKPSVFISFDGFEELDIYQSGNVAYDAEKFSIYIRTDDSVKPYYMALRIGLLELNSEFQDEDEQQKTVSMPNGQAYRDGGADAFQISVTIK